MTDTTYVAARPWYKQVTVTVVDDPVEVIITPPYVPLTSKIVVVARPVSGGTAEVHYSVDDPVAINSGTPTPTWTAWTPGAVTAASTTSSIDQPVMGIKLKATTKSATFILMI